MGVSADARILSSFSDSESKRVSNRVGNVSLHMLLATQLTVEVVARQTFTATTKVSGEELVKVLNNFFPRFPLGFLNVLMAKGTGSVSRWTKESGPCQTPIPASLPHHWRH